MSFLPEKAKYDEKEMEKWLSTNRYQSSQWIVANENDFTTTRQFTMTRQKKRASKYLIGGRVVLNVMHNVIGSMIIVSEALTLWLTKWKYNKYVDPACSLFLVAIIVHFVFPLCKYSPIRYSRSNSSGRCR